MEAFAVFTRGQLQFALKHPPQVKAVAEAGGQRDLFDALRALLKALSGGMQPPFFDNLAGEMPVSRVNTRVKLRGLIATRSANRSTLDRQRGFRDRDCRSRIGPGDLARLSG